MFTGLIQDIGRLKSILLKGDEAVLLFESLLAGKMSAGDSIAVNGVCLTAASLNKNNIGVYCSSETLKKTTVGRLKKGDRLNLELSATPSTFLGGHFVSGHIDCVGTVKKRQVVSSSLKLEISIPAGFVKFVAEKGSIAVDGISLTVNEVFAGSFSVNIIPETQKRTTIGDKKNNDLCNVECDILGKYVYNFLCAEKKGPVDLDFLKKHGF